MGMTLIRNIAWVVSFSILFGALFAGCGSIEQRRQKYFEKGKSYFEQEKYKEAQIEFKNALQIDPKFAEGYYELGKTFLKLQKLREAFGAFSKAVELNPDLITTRSSRRKILLWEKIRQIKTPTSSKRITSCPPAILTKPLLKPKRF
jgi:tetratricopeptide (TPR) repeat protein